MSTASMARFGALLNVRAATSGLTSSEFTDVVAQIAQVPTGRVKTILAGTSALEGFRLRSIVGELGLDREQVTKAVDADLLLTALWCPNVGSALADARTSAHLSWEDVASAASVSVGSVRRWEQAQVIPRVKTLNRLLTVLGLTAKDLLPFGDWPPAEVVSGQRTVFSLWLRQTREQLSLSGVALARKLAMSQGAYNAWETGRTYPADARWQRLADAFTDLGAPLTSEQLFFMQPPQPALTADTTTSLGVVISAGRYARRLCTAAAARLVGCSEGTYKHWEAGDIIPGPASLARLVDALELDVDAATTAVMTVRFADRTDRGAWIASRIHVLGWKDSQGASRVGVHRNMLSFWTTGRVPVPDDVLVRVARALRTTKDNVADMPATGDNEHTRRAAALLAARGATGLSQKELASKLGLTQMQWSSYERGIVRPSLDVMTQVMTLSLQPQLAAA